VSNEWLAESVGMQSREKKTLFLPKSASFCYWDFIRLTAKGAEVRIFPYETDGRGSGGKSGPDYPGPRLGRGPFEISSIFFNLIRINWALQLMSLIIISKNIDQNELSASHSGPPFQMV